MIVMLVVILYLFLYMDKAAVKDKGYIYVLEMMY